MATPQRDYTVSELGFRWFCRNTCGLNWLAQIMDAWTGARVHKGDPEFTLWYYLKINFRNRWPYSHGRWPWQHRWR